MRDLPHMHWRLGGVQRYVPREPKGADTHAELEETDEAIL